MLKLFWQNSLKIFYKNNKIINDPIDEKMFENSKWILNDKQNENEMDIINDNNKAIFSVNPKENN